MLRLVSRMMNVEQFLVGAKEQGLFARQELEEWQREMMACDADRPENGRVMPY